MKRRHFFLGTAAAAGALTIGWSLLPPRQRVQGADPLPAVPGQTALTGWLRIGGDGSVTVMVPKSEMGQGVHTALAMVLADELDADWAQVRVEHPPLQAIHHNQAAVLDFLPFHPDNEGVLRRGVDWLTQKTVREIGLHLTGASTSLKDLWLPMREAGASARAMLVAAAAAQWGVPAEQCRVSKGRVLHADGRSLAFAALAEAAAKQPLPSGVTLKTPDRFTLIGKTTPRIEAAARLRGEGGYGMDIVRPGMLYATARMCPTLGGHVAGFDDQAARALPGVKQVLAVPGRNGATDGVAVIADTPWHALKAIEAVQVQWDEAVPAAGFDSDEALGRLAQLLDQDDGFAYFRHGDAEGALQGAAQTVQAEYRAPWLAHLVLEPANCTVQVEGGRATVWAGTQIPGIARWAVAAVLGIDSSAVDVQVQAMGGGFGRRLDVDFIAQAAAIAAAAGGAPVQTFWTRAEDTRHDFYRPGCVARWRAGFDAQGRLLGVHAVSAGQALLPQIARRWLGLPLPAFDKTAVEGASDQPYEWPAARIAHAAVDLPVPVGFWRSVGHSHQAFFKESFVDECAHAVKQDAVAFRLALLKKHPRQAAVLRLAADKAGWGTPPPKAPDGALVARGVALHQSFGSTVAQVVEASIGPDQAIRVHRVVCAIDCGTPVNPGHIAQQMEGAVVQALSAALFGQVHIRKGQVQPSNFHDQPWLRLPACPVIETHIVPSTEPPEGVGEPGLPPLAPALASVLFALTGRRLRSLPLRIA
jgi:isoquinoline 1-oxidoreductase beta subunit